MRGRYLGWILAVAAAGAPASAGAMSAPQGRCHVVNGEKLPAEAGDEAAVCAAFEKAIADQAPKARYDKIEIEVFSKAGLGAKVLRDGRELAAQRFSIMDKNLNSESIRRFARSLASEVAKTGKS
jgi:hypothetical protein